VFSAVNFSATAEPRTEITSSTRAEALADPLRQILRVLVDAFGQRAALAQQRALE